MKFQFDFAVVGRELDGIVDQVDPYLVQQVTAAVIFNLLHVNDEFQLFFLPFGFQQENGLAHLLGQVKAFHIR